VTVVCQQANYEDMKFLQVDRLIPLDGVTEGAACTVLKACEGLEDSSLMVANSDQLLEWNPTDFIESAKGANGQIALFPGDGSKKWSYADYDGMNIKRVAEKDPISDWATCGVYWWKSVDEFKRAARNMIESNDRVNGEFYVCPVFNYMENVRGYKVRKMTGLGTPDDLRVYLGR